MFSFHENGQDAPGGRTCGSARARVARHECPRPCWLRPTRAPLGTAPFSTLTANCARGRQRRAPATWLNAAGNWPAARPKRGAPEPGGAVEPRHRPGESAQAPVAFTGEGPGAQTDSLGRLAHVGRVDWHRWPTGAGDRELREKSSPRGPTREPAGHAPETGRGSEDLRLHAIPGQCCQILEQRGEAVSRQVLDRSKSASFPLRAPGPPAARTRARGLAGLIPVSLPLCPGALPLRLGFLQPTEDRDAHHPRAEIRQPFPAFHPDFSSPTSLSKSRREV